MNVVAPSPYIEKRTGEEKTRWVTIGRAFCNDKGIWTLMLDAHPKGDKLMLFPIEERTGQPTGGPKLRKKKNWDIDDESPF